MYSMNSTRTTPWWGSSRVREPYEGVQEPYEGYSSNVRARANERMDGIKNGLWTAKAEGNKLENRYGGRKMTAFVTMTVLAVGLTLVHVAFMIQLVTYLMWAAFFFLCDPLRMWGRFLALPTRICIAGSFATAVLLFCRPGNDTLFLCVVTIAVTFLNTKYLNKKWMAAENWYMSKAAQRAMRFDSEDVSGRSWQGEGRREARAMLYELGLEAGDDVLDVYGLPLFKLGYCSGLKKQGQLNADKEKLESFRYQHQQDVRKIQQLQEQNAIYEQEEEKTRGLILAANTYQSQIAELKSKIKQLEAANEELIEDLPEEEPAQPAADNILKFSHEEEQTRQQNGALSDSDIAKIQELKEEGHSYGQIAKIVGCSKSTASKYAKMA